MLEDIVGLLDPELNPSDNVAEVGGCGLMCVGG